MKKILLVGFMIFFLLHGIATADQEVRTYTNHLLQAAKKFERANENEKKPFLEYMTDLASKRKDRLLKLLETDPEEFLLESLPSNVRKRLPGEVQNLMEQEVELDGELTVLYADDLDAHQSQLIYELTGKGKSEKQKYTLHFAGDPPGLLTGSIVHAKGISLGAELVMESGGGSLDPLAPAASGPAGDQKTIVLLINFTNNTNQPWTTTQVYPNFFTAANSVNQFYLDTSFQKVSFSGDVVGWYTVPYDSSIACDYSNWATAADSIATANGVNLSNYTHKVYLFPTTSTCSWAGLGTVGGNPSRAWSDGYNDVRLFTHELGHNLGTHHASTLSCGSKQIDLYANCTTSTYGDVYDTMGSWNLYQFNGPHKVAVGWVPSLGVQEVTASGTYTLSSLEAISAGTQTLRIPKQDTGEYYYISYRQPSGFDTTLPAGLVRGGSVHIADANGTVNTKLLDTTPGDGFGNAALSDGALFSDAINGITVTQVSHDANAALLTIQFAGPVCTKASPTVTISPLSQSVSAGKTLTYNVSVKNNDSTACSSTTFGLSGIPTPGGTLSFLPDTLSLLPGASGSTSWSVSSSPTTVDGSYTITAHTIDMVDAGHNSSANATFVVFTDPIPPTVSITDPTDGALLRANSQVTVTASASDNVGIAKVEFYVNGALKGSDTIPPYTVTFKVSPRSGVSYTVEAKACDSAGNTASHSIRMTSIK